MNSKYILLILLSSILMNSCYRPTEWEDVTSDYDPVLNVMGIISLDGNIVSFVEVYPTVDLTSVSTILIGYDSTYYEGKGEDGGYWEIYEIYKPANIIDSAIVRILSEADTFLFNYDANDGEYKNSDFEPDANSLYNLNVDVNGFDPVIGRLITPYLPHIDSSLNDTLPSSNTFSINWVNNQTSAEYGLLMGELVDSRTNCGGNFYEVVEFTSEEFTVFPEWCDPEYDVSIGDIDNDYDGPMSESECLEGQPTGATWNPVNDYANVGYCGDGNPDYETLRIRLMAMDDNYYQYFASERFKDFSNFIFEMSGTSGQSIGIEGGFGVFGAFASDTLLRTLTP